jgi:hypothetical protein
LLLLRSVAGVTNSSIIFHNFLRYKKLPFSSSVVWIYREFANIFIISTQQTGKSVLNIFLLELYFSKKTKREREREKHHYHSRFFFKDNFHSQLYNFIHEFVCRERSIDTPAVVKPLFSLSQHAAFFLQKGYSSEISTQLPVNH